MTDILQVSIFAFTNVLVAPRLEVYRHWKENIP